LEFTDDWLNMDAAAAAARIKLLFDWLNWFFPLLASVEGMAKPVVW
jgi:hypothetical protein